MAETTKIAIDLDVHRAIESRRTSFGQSHNAILREVFDLKPPSPSGPTHPPSPDPPPDPSPHPVPKPSAYVIDLLGDTIEERFLIEAYRHCLLKLADLDPGFLERLSEVTTSARRIVSRNPTDLYRKSPHLAEECAKLLKSPWWFDTNLSWPQCKNRLKSACDVADILYGVDLVIRFPD